LETQNSVATQRKPKSRRIGSSDDVNAEVQALRTQVDRLMGMVESLSIPRSGTVRTDRGPESSLSPSRQPKQTRGLRTGEFSAKVVAAEDVPPNRRRVTFQDSQGRRYTWLGSSPKSFQVQLGESYLIDGTIESQEGGVTQLTRVFFETGRPAGQRVVKPHR
jgi:hypothetical protein